MVKEYMKTCLMEIIIRETEIITTMKYHLTLMKISIIKLSTNNKAWGEKKNPSNTVMGNVIGKS